MPCQFILNIFDISSNNFSGPIPEDFIQSFESMKNIVQDEVLGNPQQYMQIIGSLFKYADW